MNDEGITEEPESISINMHPESTSTIQPEFTTPEPENSEIDDLDEVVEITDLLGMGAIWMGIVASWWAMMLMQGGIFFTTVETKDCIVIMVIFIFIYFRHGITLRPQVQIHRFDYSNRKSVWANIKECRLPLHFIDELFYWCKLVSAIICAGLSIYRLVSQDFGPSTEGKSMATTRNFALNAFHILALIEALLSLLDLILQKFIFPAIIQKLSEPPTEPPKAPPPPPKEPPPKDERKEKFTIPDEMNTYGQQKDQSNNFGVNRRKAPSVDPAGNGKQTEEKKVEVKKSQ